MLLVRRFTCSAGRLHHFSSHFSLDGVSQTFGNLDGEDEAMLTWVENTVGYDSKSAFLETLGRSQEGLSYHQMGRFLPLQEECPGEKSVFSFT